MQRDGYEAHKCRNAVRSRRVDFHVVVWRMNKLLLTGVIDLIDHLDLHMENSCNVQRVRT